MVCAPPSPVRFSAESNSNTKSNYYLDSVISLLTRTKQPGDPFSRLSDTTGLSARGMAGMRHPEIKNTRNSISTPHIRRWLCARLTLSVLIFMVLRFFSKVDWYVLISTLSLRSV
jgi:hypothetical protein